MQEQQEPTKANNEIYLTIWQIEQEFVRTRWTVVTFFISVSLAITGFSFQKDFTAPKILVMRITGLLIYWFAYLLYLHFYDYTRRLRRYMTEMETSHETMLTIQSKIGNPLNPTRWPSTIQLLLIFGLIYALGIVLLFFLQL